MILVYRYRVKSLSGLLNRQSRAVNYVWNYCNDTQKHALKWNKRWPSGFDLNVLTTGCTKEPGLHSGTVNAVCEQYAKSRSQHRRPYLRYRGKKSLAWVPLKGRYLKREGEAFRFGGNTFRVFHSRALPEGKIKDGTNFSRDRRGHWFLHKLSHRIVREFDYIAVGNVNAARLARTKMAKSVLDAAWSSFRSMLAYKAVKHGARYEEVDERFSSQVCSNCGSLARSGHRTPVEGINSLQAA